MDYAAAIRERRLPVAWRGDNFARLLATLETYLPPEDLSGVVAAYEYSAKLHDGQQRRSGAAYITHTAAVAGILAGLRLDAGTIKAALLAEVPAGTRATPGRYQ